MKQYSAKFGHLISVGILLAALILPSSAGAGILYGNLAFGNPSLSTTVSGTNWAANAFSTDGNSYLMTNVTLALEGVQGAGNVSVSLYSSTGTTPPDPNSSQTFLGTILQSALSTSGFTNQSISVSNFALTANTMYWIVLAGSSIVSADASWERENGAVNGIGIAGQALAQSGNSGASWNSRTIDSDFQPYVMEVDVQDTVPEPGTILGMVTGLAGLLALRFRNRRT